LSRSPKCDERQPEFQLPTPHRLSTNQSFILSACSIDRAVHFAVKNQGAEPVCDGTFTTEGPNNGKFSLSCFDGYFSGNGQYERKTGDPNNSFIAHGQTSRGFPTHRRSCRPSAYRRARQADACREMAGRSRRTARSDSGGRRCAGCAGARRCRRRRPRGRTADTSPPPRGRLARGRRRCAAAPTSSWLLVLVLGGRRVWLGSVDRAPPLLDVGKLMAKNDHGLVWHLGAAE
jgi:hypothetical protein